MLAEVKERLGAEIARAIQELFQVEASPVIEVPPRRDLGDLAAPAALHLARSLKRNPREIAGDIRDALELPPEVEKVTIEGPGYLNFFLRRSAFAAALLDTDLVATSKAGQPEIDEPKIIVEHTNINPNKAAHIGHLRNAVLGDVLVATLRALGNPVEVQNYIDDTGVQLADVVVGFIDLRGLDAAQIAELPEPFDYTCWDLYSEVGRWYEDEPERQQLRRDTLHALESDEGERAEVARLVARRIVSRHLRTMARLGIRYDLLTRESEILRLEFFKQAFERLVAAGAVREEATGKNAGCWIMPLAESAEFEGLEDPDKVIVRSDGTVTYVGKDIAYQLWKFGLLGRDFEYRRWEEEAIWETGATGEEGPAHPSFGSGKRVINVIDARQSYLQKIVAAGLRATGFDAEADASVHFAYEMVALSAAAAQQLGVETEEGEEGKSALMSGRKGIGVKADDLLDQLEQKARDGIAERNRELSDEELDRLSHEIAVAALRFLMVKATTTRVIHFDFEEALNFEGETGPYLQYSLVRERNIRRRLHEAGLATEVDGHTAATLADDLWEDDLWDMALSVSQISETLERAGDSLELSLIARHAVELARKFHAIYHRHPILQEEDKARRQVRLATVAIFRQGLETLLGILGVPVPERM
jgi:arginyl-tRNA synthetase